MKPLKLFLISLLITSSLCRADTHLGKVADSAETATYINARFEFSICYPKELFVLKSEADNGDGATFESKDKKAELRVFGSYNASDKSLADTMKTYSKGWNISYKTLKKNFFVISGTKEGKVMYQKTFLTGDVFKTFEITYDQSAKGVYDSVAAKISRCFKI